MSGKLSDEQVLALLEENLRRLKALTADVPQAQLQQASDGEWTLVDIIGHMRACADQWGGAIETMLAEERPTLRAINPRTWIKHTNYRELEFGASFRAFTKQRLRLLDKLALLPPKEWSRSAKVTGAGAVLTRTVHLYAQWLAQHERTHVNQIARILAARR